MSRRRRAAAAGSEEGEGRGEREAPPLDAPWPAPAPRSMGADAADALVVWLSCVAFASHHITFLHFFLFLFVLFYFFPHAYTSQSAVCSPPSRRY